MNKPTQMPITKLLVSRKCSICGKTVSKGENMFVYRNRTGSVFICIECKIKEDNR